MRSQSLSLAAQTSYPELLSQTQAFELNNALAGLVGSFRKQQLKGRDYFNLSPLKPPSKLIDQGAVQQ
jgi:hypothetical protein